MIESLEARALLFLTQSMTFSVLSFIFFMYFRIFSRPYVKYWLFSLLALTFASLFKGITFTNIAFHNDFLGQFFPVVAAQLLYYLSLLFLLFGIYNVKTNKLPALQVVFGSTVLTVIFSIVTTRLFVLDNDNIFTHFYLTVSLPSFVFGCCYLALTFYLLADKKTYFSSKLLMCFSSLLGMR